MLGDVLDVDDEHGPLHEVRVRLDETARSVESGCVMPGAGNEHERAIRPVLRLREVPGQCDEHRQSVAVVTRAVEPGVGVGVEDNHVLASSGDDRNSVLGTQTRPALAFQRQLRPHLALRSGSAIEHPFEEESVSAADVEAGAAAAAQVLRVFIAGMPEDGQHCHGAAPHQVLGAGRDGPTIEHHVRLRHDELHRNLPCDVEVRHQ